MSWKTELKLSDLEAATALEVMCKRCGQSRYESQAQICRAYPELRQAYLDEVENRLHCSSRFCRGGVRIALVHDDKNESFVGGMA